MNKLSEVPSCVIFNKEFTSEFLVPVFFDGLANAFHEAKKVTEVMDGRQSPTRDLARFKQMPDICS